MTSTAISPFIVGDLTQVELADDKDKKKVWRKQILPAGTRQYKGQTLDFGKINPACIAAFEGGAFDAVPFVLALADNRHPRTGQEAEQLEGDVVKLELGEDGGLIGYFDLSHSARVEDTIRKSNGKFGVSGRIEVDYTAEDSGKHFDYALSHVCGTTRPHIKGLAGWQPVELSDAEKERPVIDFSKEIEDEVTDNIDDKETGDGDLVTVPISQAQLDRLLSLLDNDGGDTEDDEDGIEETADEIAAKGGNLSPEAQQQIAAAEASAARALELAERMQVSAAQERWSAQRSVLLSEGVPPAILDLAGKVLSRHRNIVLEFAEGDTVDATSVVTDILNECKGYIALGEERGHQFREPQDSPENAAYRALDEAFNEMWAHDGRSR